MHDHFTGIIKPGIYGKRTIDGIEYIKLYPWWARPLLLVIKFTQRTCWWIGIAIHDPIFGECTPDFNCCCRGIGRKAYLRISK